MMKNTKGQIVHLFPKTQFTEGAVLFFEHYFDMKQHVIILYTNKSFLLPQYIYEKEFIEDYDAHSIFWLRKKLKSAGQIILHNLSVTFDIMNLLYSNPEFSKKSMWVIWGSDLYCHEDIRKNIIDKYVEHMRKSIISKLPWIGSLSVGDYELALRWYRTKAANIRLEYCDENEFSVIKAAVGKSKNDSRVFNVLVGNSATRSNCHKEIFDVLSKFKDENIHLVVPISYGDMDYAREIKEYGTGIFQDKIEFLEEFLERKEYFGILSDMDVAVFNNNRQQALGNIYALLYMKKKLYMKENTSMWDEFVNLNKYRLESCRQIQNEDWDSFSEVNCEKIEYNACLAEQYYDFSKRAEEWEAVFDLRNNS